MHPQGCGAEAAAVKILKKKGHRICGGRLILKKSDYLAMQVAAVSGSHTSRPV